MYWHRAFQWWNSDIPAVPLLGSLEGTATALHQNFKDASVLWERQWPTAPCRYMAHHRVGDVPLAPGTAYLCMAREALLVHNRKLLSVEVVEARFDTMLVLDLCTPVLCVSMQRCIQGHLVTIESKGAEVDCDRHASMVVSAPLLPNEAPNRLSCSHRRSFEFEFDMRMSVLYKSRLEEANCCTVFRTHV